MNLTLHECVPLSARITKEQCARNRDKYEQCKTCNGLILPTDPLRLESPSEPDVSAKQDHAVIDGDVYLVFRGEDARVLQQIVDQAKIDKTDPAADVATIIELFLDGRLALVD